MPGLMTSLSNVLNNVNAGTGLLHKMSGLKLYTSFSLEL